MRTLTTTQRDADGAPIQGIRSSDWSVTHSHATAALATKAVVAGHQHVIVMATASSDKADSVMQIKQGATVLWDVQVGIGRHTEDFSGCPLVLAPDTAVNVEIDGTALCKANVRGFVLVPVS